MRNQNTSGTGVPIPPRVTVLLPGWADEASTLPHPAPLTEPTEMALANALGVPFPTAAAIPGANCRWTAANSESPPGHLVCADPVHLLAGSDDAQLVPSQRLNLSIEETTSLIEELNDALGDNPCSFLHDTAGQWYHQGLKADALTADPTTAVEGHAMTAALPRSDAARPWRSLWSEVQMVLHQSRVNAERQARGETVINSVWFWGGGAFTKPTESINAVLYADDQFAQGLANGIGVQCLPLADANELDLSNTDIAHHVILDTTLMQGNPDFVDQRDLGAQWLERLTTLLANTPSAKAELNGLTGCHELLLPKDPAPTSIFTRLAKLLKR